MKFKRKRVVQTPGQFYPHPEGFAGVGIHALDSEKWMTLEEIMDENIRYCQIYGGVSPTWGELLRDMGLLVCFHMVEIQCD